ncbi:hypothetical protein AS19_26080 [Alcanivorax sp. NBRC 101098]|nr:ATP-binding protein [Alcanivorax sp. NBRC 101098]BAP15459.1 hypothetical protein AS19_26080 [Alcanivorax sp. NBRC 101098]
MVSPRVWLVFGLLALLVVSPLQAAESAACEAAELTHAQLNQQRKQLQENQAALLAMIKGEIPTSDQLDTVLGRPLNQRPLLPLPPPQPLAITDSKCPDLQNDIDNLTRQINSLEQSIHTLRHSFFSLSFAQRQAFRNLAIHHEQLQAMADNPDATIASASQRLQQHTEQLWAVLGQLQNNPDIALQTLDALWLNLPALPLPSSGVRSDEWRTLLKARLDIQSNGRTLRSEQWKTRPLLTQIDNLGGLRQAPQLLQHESQRITQHLRNILVLVRYDLNGPLRDGGYMPVLQNILALILGAAGFWLLIQLAQRTRHWALALHDRVVQLSGERRWLLNASRLISGLAPILPWVLIWLALDHLGSLLDTPSSKILLWLLPLAQLYVIYGLLCLIGEWLILRVAQSANAYLGGEQTRQVTQHARNLARWIIIPWAPVIIVWESLGPSLMYYLFLGVLMVTIYTGLGRLLALRHKDYQVCLQAPMPSQVDPLIARLLSPRLFWLVAPLLLPIALVSFLVGFVDRVLADFDWYMRLKARWFRFRANVATDEDDGGNSEEPVAQSYERWFAPALPDDVNKPPFIDTGLVAAIEKSIQRWHEDKTDENALVVSGEKGCGKSVSLGKLDKVLEKSCESLNTLHLKVPAKTCTPEAIHQLIGDALGTDLINDGPAALVKDDEHRQPTLVVLDEAQNFFLAQLGGLEGWRTVLNLVNARVDNVFWLLLINNQSWAYLCNVFGREYQFRNVVRVKRWGQTDIRSLILSRHHLSGFQLRYDEVLLSSRGPEAGNLRNAEQRYFSLLWDASRGNPMVALRLFLTSVKVKGRQVTVGLPNAPSASILDGMGDNSLFVYAAIATHENLTSHEISAVTHLPENVVRYALKGGFDAGFLHKSDDGRYRLVSLWYQQVISYLTRKNLLNE